MRLCNARGVERVLERLDRWPRVRATADFLVAYGKEFGEDRVSGLSAEVAFWWILSLFPALLVMAAVLGSLDSVVGQEVSADVEQEVLGFVEDFFGGEAQNARSATEAVFSESPAGLLTVGVLLALWSTSKAFLTLIQALDIVYDLEERRGYLRLRLMGMGMGLLTIVIAALTMSMIAVGPLLGKGEELAGDLGLGSWFAWFWDVLRVPLAGLLAISWIATIYHWAPARETRWRWDLPGAVLALVAWWLASLGFRIYLSFSSDSSFVVGVLGGALVMLLWFWLLAIGLLAGGELNAQIVRWFDVDQEQRPQVLRPALRRLNGKLTELRTRERTDEEATD